MLYTTYFTVFVDDTLKKVFMMTIRHHCKIVQCQMLEIILLSRTIALVGKNGWDTKLLSMYQAKINI